MEEGREVFLERWNLLEGKAQGLEVAGVAGVLGETGGGAFDVADVFEGLAYFREDERLGEEGGDGFLALFEFFDVAERVKQPIAEKSAAHGRLGFVQDS